MTAARLRAGHTSPAADGSPLPQISCTKLGNCCSSGLQPQARLPDKTCTSGQRSDPEVRDCVDSLGPPLPELLWQTEVPLAQADQQLSVKLIRLQRGKHYLPTLEIFLSAQQQESTGCDHLNSQHKAAKTAMHFEFLLSLHAIMSITVHRRGKIRLLALFETNVRPTSTLSSLIKIQGVL